MTGITFAYLVSTLFTLLCTSSIPMENMVCLEIGHEKTNTVVHSTATFTAPLAAYATTRTYQCIQLMDGEQEVKEFLRSKPNNCEVLRRTCYNRGIEYPEGGQPPQKCELDQVNLYREQEVIPTTVYKKMDVEYVATPGEHQDRREHSQIPTSGVFIPNTEILTSTGSYYTYHAK